MMRLGLYFVVAILVAGAGCRSSGTGFKFHNPAAASHLTPDATVAPAAQPWQGAATTSRPAEPAAPGVAWVDQMGQGDGADPQLDPEILKNRSNASRVRVWAVPGCRPEDRPVDPRVYTDPVRAGDRLAIEELNVLAAQGQLPQGAVGVDVNLGDPSAARNGASLEVGAVRGLSGRW